MDLITVLEVQELAVAWNVPKSEAVRRAVHAAARQKDALGHRPMTPKEALDALQQGPRLSKKEAEQWATSVRKERRATRRA